jgi:hypothetical protein
VIYKKKNILNILISRCANIPTEYLDFIEDEFSTKQNALKQPTPPMQKLYASFIQ